jgi:hypothetical protein
MDADKRNLIVSYIAGALFTSGWWFLIDANVMSNFYQLSDGKVTGIHYLSAIGSTLSLIL